MSQFLKIGKASQVLGVSTRVLRDWADSGDIRCIRTPGGQRLFDPSSIDGFAVKQEKPERLRILRPCETYSSFTQSFGHLDRIPLYCKSSFKQTSPK